MNVLARMRGRPLAAPAASASSVEVISCDVPPPPKSGGRGGERLSSTQLLIAAASWGGLITVSSGGRGGERLSSTQLLIAAASWGGLITVSSVGGVQDTWSGIASYSPHFLDATAVNQTLWYEFRSALAHELVEVLGEGEVRQYLEAHPDMLVPVAGVCKAARCEFGWGAALTLKLYCDPEFPDEHLSLYVRLPSYPADVLTRIRGVSERHEANLRDKSGSILVTTDFRPTR